MRRRGTVLAAYAALSLTVTGCASGNESGRPQATGPREPISLRDDGDACGSSLVQSFVGLRANDAVRQTVAERSGARNIRWIAPGQAVTMDYSESRLSAELDSDGVIVTMSCG